MVVQERFRRGLAWAALLLLSGPVFGQTAITYQGQLQQAGEPFTGLADLEFALYDSLTAGTLVAGPVSRTGVPVEDGLFQVELDFGPGAFGDSNPFLELVVDGTVLEPRQPVTAAPRSLRSNFAEDGNWAFSLVNGSAVFNPSGSGGVSINIGGNGPPNADLQVNGEAIFGNVNNTADGPNSFVTGGDPFANNTASGPRSFVGGGFLNTSAGFESFVGGGNNNEASMENAAVIGGNRNKALALNAIVAGGLLNEAGEQNAAIIGGAENTAMGLSSVVLGGLDGDATGRRAVVIGGVGGVASGTRSMVIGGIDSRSEGFDSVALGGSGNTASGNVSYALGSDAKALADRSFALGTDAIAAHRKAFVWSGSASGDSFSSTDSYQFLIRADHGMGLNTETPEAPLHVVGPSPDLDPFGQLRLEGTETSGAEGTGAGISFIGHDGNIRRIWGHIESVKVNSAVGNTASRMSFYTRGLSGLPDEQVRINWNGQTFNKTGTWSFLSDERLKTDIRRIERPLDRLLGLNGVQFRFREDIGSPGGRGPRMGFIAQQVERVLPDWVTETAEGFKAVTPSGFRALTVEAIRELQAQTLAENQRLRATHVQLVERLAEVEGRVARMDALVERNARLEERLAALEAALNARRLASSDAP